MKLLIHHKKNTHYNLGGEYFEAAGLLFTDISPIRKYISEVNDNYYFTYAAPKIINKAILLKMVNLFPADTVLRFGSYGMLADVMGLFKYNFEQKTKHQKYMVRTLYESLYIYWVIRKECNPFKNTFKL
jgi:hypothetical protein